MLKAHAFMDYAFSVCGSAYMAMFYVAIGLPVGAFFLLSIISVITAMISQNLISKTSDKYGNRLDYMLSYKALYAISMLSVAFIPTFPVVIIATILMNLVSGEMFSAAVVYELIDQVHASLEGEKKNSFNKSKEFSKYRIFGSLGWAFTAPFGGMAIDYLNGIGMANGNDLLGYTVMFSISAIGVGGLGIILRYALKGYENHPVTKTARDVHNQEQTKKTKEKSTENYVKRKKFYLNPMYLMLVVSAFIYSIGMSLQINTRSPYLKRGHGISDTFFGWLMFTWATSEVPLFFLSSYIVKKIGWKSLVLLSYIFLIIKSIVYIIVVDPSFLWLILVIQVFNPFGISYPAYSYAITNELAQTQKALGMTLNQTLKSLGSFTGGIVGMLLDFTLGSQSETLTGYQLYFWWSIIFSIVAIIVFIAIYIQSTVRSTNL